MTTMLHRTRRAPTTMTAQLQLSQLRYVTSSRAAAALAGGELHGLAAPVRVRSDAATTDANPESRTLTSCAPRRRSAPTTSAACSARQPARGPRRLRRRADRRRAPARRRGRGDPRRRRDAGRRRAAVGHRRRVPPRLLAHGLHLPARRDRARRQATSRCKFRNDDGDIEFTPAALHVGSKLRLDHTIFADDFRYLQSAVGAATPKLTIPSPSMVHYRGGPAAIDHDVYPDMEEFWADLSAAYADEVQRLAELGCTLPAARRHQPGLSQRPGAAGRDRRARRGRRAPAPALHPPGQRRARRPARRA